MLSSTAKMSPRSLENDGEILVFFFYNNVLENTLLLFSFSSKIDSFSFFGLFGYQ